VIDELTICAEHSIYAFLYSDAKNMATDVRNIMLNVIKTNGKLTDTDAQQYIKKMEAQKRYSADVWS
jgi:NADPH-ferrihemoprotein reductase